MLGSSLFVALLAAAPARSPSPGPRVFLLGIRGEEGRVEVSLGADGDLRVERPVPPSAFKYPSTPSPPRVVTVKISAPDRDELRHLAEATDDFTLACHSVEVSQIDAELVVESTNPTQHRSCYQAGEWWPVGPHTTTFFEAINRHLRPSDRILHWPRPSEPLFRVIWTAGMQGGSTTASLSANGELRIAQTASPVRPQARVATVMLSPADRDELARLANATDDFGVDCSAPRLDNGHIDFYLLSTSPAPHRVCSSPGATSPPHTQAFFAAIHRHLPREDKIF